MSPSPKTLGPLLLAVVLAGAAVAIGYRAGPQFSGPHGAADPGSVAGLDQPQPGETAEPVRSVTELFLTVERGDTLEKLFRHHDLSLQDLADIIRLEAAGRHLRVLRPGDSLRIQYDDGRVMSLQRDIDLRSALAVTRDGQRFLAEVIRLPVEVRMVEATGRISRSLYEAGTEARLSDRIIMSLTDIFRWDIDFVRDLGLGDEFSLIYEELWRDGEKLGEGNVLAAEFINRGSRYTAIRFEDAGGTVAYYTAEGRPLHKAFLRVPVAFTRISSEFNPRRRHPILNTIRAHRGVDYAAPAGTPVKAAGDGKIIFRGWKSGYGNTVIVQHGGNVTTLYGHLSRFATDARYGSRVRQGEVIAFVGATGLATAPHLHYEYRRNGVHLNPRTVELPDAEPLAGAQLVAFRAASQPLLERLQGQRTLVAANRSDR